MKDLLLDDIFIVVFALLTLGIASMFILSPELSEKVLIGVSSALAGIAKGEK